MVEMKIVKYMFIGVKYWNFKKMSKNFSNLTTIFKLEN